MVQLIKDENAHSLELVHKNEACGYIAEKCWCIESAPPSTVLWHINNNNYTLKESQWCTWDSAVGHGFFDFFSLLWMVKSEVVRSAQTKHTTYKTKTHIASFNNLSLFTSREQFQANQPIDYIPILYFFLTFCKH